MLRRRESQAPASAKGSAGFDVFHPRILTATRPRERRQMMAVLHPAKTVFCPDIIRRRKLFRLIEVAYSKIDPASLIIMAIAQRGATAGAKFPGHSGRRMPARGLATQNLHRVFRERHPGDHWRARRPLATAAVTQRGRRSCAGGPVTDRAARASAFGAGGSRHSGVFPTSTRAAVSRPSSSSMTAISTAEGMPSAPTAIRRPEK